MEVGVYEVIARRCRPKQFSELVGQEPIVRTLTNAIERKRIAHAYLFVGPRGTGKTSMARLFAMALNCTGGPSIEPPLDCDICKAIMEGRCLDVIEIDGASNNSVDQVRDLREACQYAPAQARFKIYIIDEVHMLTNAAFNALLKTLEEPPAHVKFIFATTEAHKVLPTIVSRCQRFEFRPIADGVIAQKLKFIAEAEGLEVEDGVFFSIARLAGGGMRDAQTILDQLISFCGKRISEQDIINVYGLASLGEIKALAAAMAEANYTEVIRMVGQFDEQGRDFYRILQDLQHVIHGTLLDSVKNKGVSVILGNSLSTESLMRMLEVLREGERFVCTGLSEKVNFELTLFRAVEQSRTRAIDSLIKDIAALKDQYPEESGEKKKEPTAIELASVAELVEVKEEAGACVESIGELDDAMIAEAESLEFVESFCDTSCDEVPVSNDLRKNSLSKLEEVKTKLPQGVFEILENRFRAQIKKVGSFSSDEWLGV